MQATLGNAGKKGGGAGVMKKTTKACFCGPAGLQIGTIKATWCEYLTHNLGGNDEVQTVAAPSSLLKAAPEV